MKHLLPFLKGYRLPFFLGCLFKLLEAIFELCVPLITARLIDRGIAAHDRSVILSAGSQMILFAVLGLVCALLCQYFAAKCAFGACAAMRQQLFHHVLSMDAGTKGRFGTAALITRLTADTNAVQSGLNMFIRLATRLPYIILGAAVMAMRIDLRLSVIFFAAIAVIGTLLWAVSAYTVPRFARNQARLDRIALHTQENLDGARVIRAFCRQPEETAAFAEQSNDYALHSIRVQRIAALLNPMSFLLMNLSIAAILWFGGIRVEVHGLSQGDLTAFVNYMTQIALALVRLAELVLIFNKAYASAGRLVQVFQAEPAGDGTVSRLAGETDELLAFDHVSYTYENGGAPALDQVSFTLHRGETLGVIGGTGSGKSTLARLCIRELEPVSGHVRLCGASLSAYSRHVLAQCISVVPQTVQLLSGSIAENLRLRDSQADDQALEAACRTAQAWDFICEKPGGLQANIAQGAKNFSGGQRQRLTIARALVNEPPILILDDSMSALDYATDKRLRAALAHDLPRTAKILISQRTSSIAHADHILVLDHGQIVGSGTHESLLRSCPLYREIHQTQQR